MKKNYLALRQNKRVKQATLLACILACNTGLPLYATPAPNQLVQHVQQMKLNPKIKSILLGVAQNAPHKNPKIMQRMQAVIKKKQALKKNTHSNDVIKALKFIEQNIEHLDPEDAFIATEALANYKSNTQFRAGETPPNPVEGVIQQDNITLAGNTAIGYNSLGNQKGSYNTAVGLSALANLTSSGSKPDGTPAGVNNTAVGAFALENNKTGLNNIALGYNAGSALTDGDNNIHIGNAGTAKESGIIRIGTPGVHSQIFLAGALDLNGSVTFGQNIYLPTTTASQGGIYINGAPFINAYNGNTAIGINAGSFISSGGVNTAIGDYALASNTSGDYNTAVGFSSLASNTIGTCNTAQGFLTLLDNTTGVGNVAIGTIAMVDNTVGYANTAVGDYALALNITGTYNAAYGLGALTANRGGGGNSAFGTGAGTNLEVGDYNIFVGAGAGSNLINGDYNIFIDSQGSDFFFDDYESQKAGNYNICIGNTGYTNDSNIIRLGTITTHTSCFIAGIRGVTTTVNNAIPVLIDSHGQLGTFSSSCKFKKDIAPLNAELSSLEALNPVSFSYKSDATGRKHYGLIAEEVYKIFPELVAHDRDGSIETVMYHELPTLLLAGYKQQQAEIKTQKEMIEKLTERFAHLETNKQ